MTVVRAKELIAGIANPSATTSGGGKIGATKEAIVKPRSLAVACFGDSRLANGKFVSGYNTFNKPIGAQHWAASISGNRLYFPPEANLAVSGYTTNQMLSILPASITTWKSQNIDTVVCWWGTNDLTSIPLDTTKRNLITMVNMMRAAGLNIVSISETPRTGAYALTPTQNANHKLLHDWLQDVLPLYGVYPVNLWDIFVDPSASSSLYTPYSQYTYDGIHPSIRGAYVAGKTLWEQAFSLLFTQPEGLLFDSLVYSSSNPTGSLLKNALLEGTGGTFASNVTKTAGSVLATSWTLESENSTGLTVTAYKEAAKFGEAQVLRIIGTTGSSGASFSFFQDLDLTMLTSGDKIKGTNRIISKGENINSCSLNILQVPKYALFADMDVFTTTYPAAMEGTRGTPILTYDPSTQTMLRMYAYLSLAAGVTVDVTLKISQMGIQKVYS